jgi:hypothetical protein
MKFKKSRLERACSNCEGTIKKGDLYGQKSKSYPVWQTHWSIDQRPKEEIPDWAWEKVYFSDKFDWCKHCGEKEAM